ncbi:MAG: hypothetical protein A2X13_10585 [Bacteroidetes bacterium GWC2_33_15]|nr:MAG: hypothetical protein A2X10_03135 [Bacteroidetes bacterium GWA2_33_15]OFX48844.1 MAG: hypothetical protein A2X13_10585 [Bacteroidetes bacterium GWC2_33_15]OFX66087.1 MAG: hypothetical protein A2X15_11730 [Bacteroidetes bacterium GWB2_32_14]OFX68151.1 MAG: hypothetical protein A2X14_07165 [Bacteroidetes bacterium GWD2_33_33]HAN17923.1 hypothetical protein [Bacteroidales bacterium]
MDSLIKKFAYKRYYVLSVLLLVGNHLYSQNIVSDTKGLSSISLNPGFKETKKDSSINDSKVEEIPFNLGIIKVITSDKKLELNHYSYFSPEKFTDFFIGISAAGELKNSVANLFSSGNVVSGGDATLRFGLRLFKNNSFFTKYLIKDMTKEEIQEVLDKKTKPASDLWLITTGKFIGSSFKLFQPDSVFSKQIEKTNFTGTEINIGLNYWNARILNTTILAGATIGYKRINNFDDLTESISEDTKLVSDSITGATRKIVTKQTLYTGNYKETVVYPLNFDLYLVPHKLENVSLLAYSRTDISKAELSKTKLGFGVFFLRKQNAFNPVAGITFDYVDVFNVDKSDDNKGTLFKFKIGITTRINIVNNQMNK